MIKINLVSEGKTVRGAGAAPAMGGVTEVPSGNLNNKILAGLTILGLLLAGGYWFVRNSALNSTEEVAVQKRAEAASLEKIIKEVEQFKKRKDDLESRIALINDLKRNQKVPVRVMDRVSQDLPDLVWLDRMEMEGSSVSVSGRALNENAIALFIENLKKDGLFSEPILKRINRTAPNVYTYEMSFTFSVPRPEGEEGEAGEPAAAPAR